MPCCTKQQLLLHRLTHRNTLKGCRLNSKDRGAHTCVCVLMFADVDDVDDVDDWALLSTTGTLHESLKKKTYTVRARKGNTTQLVDITLERLQQVVKHAGLHQAQAST